MEIVSENKSHGGRQLVVRHPSSATDTDMTFSIFLPPQAEQGGKLPVVWYLSGLTCTHANVTEKGEYRAACAEHGLIFVAPDTSPRGDDVPTDARGRMGFRPGRGLLCRCDGGAVGGELPHVELCHRGAAGARRRRVPGRHGRARRITGHSMGGHGALTVALELPERFRSVSAFAPIVAPGQVPWGQKALGGYLGEDPRRMAQA